MVCVCRLLCGVSMCVCVCWYCEVVSVGNEM